MTERVMRTIRRLLNWLAVFCLAGFFFPYFQHTTIQGVSEKKFTLGVPFSPWLIASWKKAEDKIEKTRTARSDLCTSASPIPSGSSSLVGRRCLALQDLGCWR